MTSAARLLGFAFSNADFLFEIDKTGIVLFAAGAAKDLVHDPAGTLVGSPADKLFDSASQTKFQQLVRSLKLGQRSGPLSLTLATGVQADVAMFHLPENGPNISCTLARSGAHIQPGLDSQTGLASRDAFIAAAAKSDPSDALSLLDLPELPALCAKLPPRDAD